MAPVNVILDTNTTRFADGAVSVGATELSSHAPAVSTTLNANQA
tara:strand:+ start:279 stop:410 length:132 start_codon:yes stop_codon:yes gene_type:complete